MPLSSRTGSDHRAPSQLALLCLLLSRASSQQSGGSSVRTNKQGSAKAETANWGFWVPLPPPPSLQLHPKLCSLSLCALPHFQGTQTQEQQIIFLSIHTSPSILSLARPALPAPANRLLWQRSSLAADQSESRGRKLPGSDWPSQPGERSGGRCTHGPCPGSAHPFICLHDKPGPLSLGRKLEDKHC